MKTFNKFLFFFSFVLLAACSKETTAPPKVTTISVNSIATTSAVSGGTVTDDGGASVTSQGVCWGTSDNPTTGDYKTVDAGSGSFKSNLSDLLPATQYFVRAYAINSAGIGYGKSVSFTTLGGKPSLTLSDAANIDLNSATLSGSVNPNSLLTTVTFEYGLDTEYGSTAIPVESIEENNSSQEFHIDLTGLNPGTTYHFRVKAENSLGTIYSPDKTFRTLGDIPSITVNNITDLQMNSAELNASINANYFTASVVLEYGTTESYDNTVNMVPQTVAGHSLTDVSVKISGLVQGTLYHFRVTSTNVLGSSASDDGTFMTLAPITDAEGNTYKIRTYGTQVWMTENLRTAMYNNGDSISTTIPATLDISNEVEPEYQWAYDGDEGWVPTYGRLYTWYAVTDARGVCPDGWHLPSDVEWTTLVNYIADQGYGYEGSGDDIAKSMASITGWMSYSTPGTIGYDPSSNNLSGFNALPSGARITYTGGLEFSMSTSSCAWWSITSLDNSTAYQWILVVTDPNVSHTYYGSKKIGISVRCVKDN